MSPTRATTAAVTLGTSALVMLCSGCGQPAPTSPAPSASASATTSTAPDDNIPAATAVAQCRASEQPYQDGKYAGSRAEYRYGEVTVEVTVTGGCIVQVATNRKANSGYSDQLQTKAEPALKEKVLVANSAEISTVSGATYTSKAYRTSLQAAVDQARQGGAAGTAP